MKIHQERGIYTKLMTIAKKLLWIETIVILLFFTFFLFCYLRDRAIDPIRANYQYAEQAEYIVTSFGIALLSSLLVDIVERSQT